MMYDETWNEWKNISPTWGDAPAPWYGHNMICFYNYIFVFGGQGDHGTVFGDLWVFNILWQDWILIIDADKTHELTHEKVTGIIPSPWV